MANVDKNELIKSILEQDEILEDEEEVLHMLVKEKVSENINVMHKEKETFGSRASDRMAKLAGSWGFVITFLMVIVLWITVNSIFKGSFDTYPFILLNLLLSCIAAIQAPVIMMSQNRQEEKDRLRAQNDYKVNVKSELIVEDLHKKLDMLIENQKVILEKIAKE